LDTFNQYISINIALNFQTLLYTPKVVNSLKTNTMNVPTNTMNVPVP